MMRNLFWSFEPVMKSRSSQRGLGAVLRGGGPCCPWRQSVEPLNAVPGEYETYLDFLLRPLDGDVVSS